MYSTHYYHNIFFYFHLPITFGFPSNENDRDDVTSVMSPSQLRKRRKYHEMLLIEYDKTSKHHVMLLTEYDKTSKHHVMLLIEYDKTSKHHVMLLIEYDKTSCDVTD